MNIYDRLYKRFHGGQHPPQSTFLVPSMCRNAVRGIPDGIVYGTGLSVSAYFATYFYFESQFGNDPSLNFARRMAMKMIGESLVIECYKIGIIAGMALGARRGYKMHSATMSKIIKDLKG